MSNATQNLANVLVQSAIEFMVEKSGKTAAEIMGAVAADPKGNTARYFADLINAGVRNADAIIDGRQVTAETIQ